MAENRDDIGVNIGADVAPLERALKKASEMFKNFGQLAKNTAKDMANAFKDVAKNPKNYALNEFSNGFDPKAVEERIKELTRLEKNAFYEGGVSDEQRQAWEEERNMLIEKMNRYEEYIARQTEHANKLEKLKERFRKLKEKTGEVFSASGLGGESSKANLSEVLDDTTRSLKRFIKGLIGVQTMVTLAKKLAGSNKELSNSVKILWEVLGQAWAPLFNGLANIIKQIVVYFASIYKYIFGVNILDKALKNGAKNAKSIKNSLAGFDEITNLDKGSGDTGWLADLKNLKLDMEWVEAFNDLTGIPDLLKDIVGWIKDPSWEAFDRILGDTSGLLTTFGLILVAIGNPFFTVVGWVVLLINWFKNLGVHVNEFTGTLAVDTSKWSDKLKEFGKKFEAWKQGILDGIVSAVKYVWSKISWLFTSSKDKTDETTSGFKKFVNGLISFTQGMINIAILGLNWLIRQINKIHFTLPDWLGGKSFGFNISEVGYADLPRLATGTNYVPSDQLAYLHQGEAVIPKKFNEKEYFGSGNEETNMLLSNILNIVSNMDMNPQVAVSDIVKGINKQSRLKGVSVV